MSLYAECFKALAPEILIVSTALLMLLMDASLLRRRAIASRAALSAVIACLGCALAMAWLALVPCSAHVAMLAITPLTQWIKMPLLLLTMFAAALSWNQRFTRHVGEYFALLLLGASGLMLLVSSDNLLMIFLALELLSLSLYSLAAFDKGSLASSEAALKYLLFGGVSAAFTLFGISLIYGIAGDTQLDAIAAALAGHRPEPLFYVALVMTLVGFAFKLAAAPFHLWAPDVYEGAPTPVAAFIASGSKVASFFVLARLLLTAFQDGRGAVWPGEYLPGWAPVLATLAVLSMVAGNVAAIVQSNVKRLLACSAIAHAGYALLALLAAPAQALSPLLYYTITYAFTVLGAFAVVGVVEAGGRGSAMAQFGGLSRRAPVMSFCMLVFMLSLAGIPPTAGFLGKYYIFLALIQSGHYVLAVVATLYVAVAIYYYFKIVRSMFIREETVTAPLATTFGLRLALGVTGLLTLVIGIYPEPFLQLARTSLVR